LKKAKKKWSDELKCVTTTTKTKVAKVRAELSAIDTANVNTTATLPQQCRLSDKLNVLFEPGHARRFRSHFLNKNSVL